MSFCPKCGGIMNFTCNDKRGKYTCSCGYSIEIKYIEWKI